MRRGDMLPGSNRRGWPTREYRRRSAIREPGPRDYRLLPTSPARNEAVAQYSRHRDFTGRKRNLGAGPDIGAHER
jgi:hypothetical protein